jgi:hypothetical protein
MKQIQAVSIWYNGQIQTATLFNLISVADNLTTTASFYYELLKPINEFDNQVLSHGNINMTGFDYDAYSSSPDSNAYAYQWAATQLNLTLV